MSARWLGCVVCAGALSLLSCAHMISTLDSVELGMTSAALPLSPNEACRVVQSESVEYRLYCVVASVWAMYSDHPHSVLFVRIENEVVVDKGVVGKREERRIQKIDPRFDLRELQAR